MRRLGVGAVLVAVVGLACTGRPVSPPPHAGHDLPALFEKTEMQEQGHPLVESLETTLQALDTSVDAPDVPVALESFLVSLDRLVGRKTVGLDMLGSPTALAYRVPKGTGIVLARLAAAYQRGGGRNPLLRPLLAAAATSLAVHDGDAALARVWRQRSACVRSAAVLGPTDWAALSALRNPLPLERPGAPFPTSVAGVPPFAGEVKPVVAHADGCEIETNVASSALGLRVVVVDADVPRAGRVWVALTSTSAAVVSIGGKETVRRTFDAGAEKITRFGTATVSVGRIRVVVRVAQRDDSERVVLRLVGDDGSPFALHVPASGGQAPGQATDAAEMVLGAKATSPQEKMLAASALLAVGDGRGAEQILEHGSIAADVSGLWLLAHARALASGSLLPEVRRVERQRELFERALARLPHSWEAAMGAAVLAGQRRGLKEGRVEMLSALQRLREHGLPPNPLLEVFEAAVASRSDLFDRAEQAYARAAASLGDTAVLRELETRVHRRVGIDRVRVVCGVGVDRDGLACFEALVMQGDTRGALQEITRLRELRDSRGAFQAQEISQHIARGDGARALAVYDAMPSGQRIPAALSLLVSSQPAEVRARLARDLPTMVDGPDAALSLRRVLLHPEEVQYDELGAKLVAADRARRAMPEAATLVLEHREQYTLGTAGVLLYTLYDLRRVSGTTDVDQGTGATEALIEGRDSRRFVRKRIHKKDGLVLEPDQAAHASQEHAELAQLEQGDYVEQLVSGVALPGNMGQIVVDTPDMLPSRTSVLHARVEVRFPNGWKLSRWFHPLFGRVQERTDGGQSVWEFALKNQGPRRLEMSTPKMEQQANVTFGTQTWENIACGIGELLLSMQARDSIVDGFARAAVGDEVKPSVKMLDRLVAAVAKKVRVSQPVALSDSSAAFPSGTQEVTARSALELGQGSRSWFVHQALGALGIRSEIVVAEPEPFAADPNYPPHVGRFEHPLLIVPIPSEPSAKNREIWLDLDVAGPPLPPGKVSPELRGRKAIRVSGEMLEVPEGSESGPDEVDVRLTVNEQGDAKGTLTVLLQGRAAQTLADAFEQKAGSDRRDMLRAVVLGWVPWANVDDVVLSSAEGSWQLALRATISIPGFAQPQGTSFVLLGMPPLHMVTPAPASATIAATFAAQGGRQTALAIDTAYHYHVHRRVDLPAGWSVLRVPAALQVKEGPIQAERSTQAEGSVVEENFTLSLATGTIGPGEFDAFAETARRIDDAFLAGIQVRAGATPR